MLAVLPEGSLECEHFVATDWPLKPLMFCVRVASKVLSVTGGISDIIQNAVCCLSFFLGSLHRICIVFHFFPNCYAILLPEMLVFQAFIPDSDIPDEARVKVVDLPVVRSLLHYNKCGRRRGRNKVCCLCGELFTVSCSKL